MSRAEFENFMNFACKAIMDAANSCSDLEDDRYVTMHVSPDGKEVSWNNAPDKEDPETPRMSFYYSKEEGQWIASY